MRTDGRAGLDDSSAAGMAMGRQRCGQHGVVRRPGKSVSRVWRAVVDCLLANCLRLTRASRVRGWDLVAAAGASFG